MADTSPPVSSSSPWIARGQRALGIVVLLLAYVPLYSLMDTSAEAPHRRVSVEVASVTLQLAWWGTLMTVLLSWILERLLPSDALRGLLRATSAWLSRPSRAAYALTLAALSTGIATLVGLVLYQGYFTNVDEIAYTVHARYLATGRIAGPVMAFPEFWLIPNTLMVPEGWISQFPPTHVAAMGGMIRLGLPLLLGPLSVGAMTGLLALALPRLLPDRPRVARIAALAVAVCPFLLFLGGGSMSHVTAGALGAAVLYLALRARDGHAAWAGACGAAVGLMVSGRPLIGLVLGSVLTLGVWLPEMIGTGRRAFGWLAGRAGWTLLGGAPIAALLGWYNARLFGDPLRLGYVEAFGDRHRLGFHMDPWGYMYDVREAVAFTSSDVLSAGVLLMETPFPITALIGLWLLLGPRPSRGRGVLLAWAFLPVLANAFYWFHDSRMLYEAAPAWVALAVLAAADLTGGVGPTTEGGLRPRGRDIVLWAMVVGAVGAVALGIPGRYQSYGWTQETLTRITAPAPPTEEPPIVFVHVSWNERLSSTLQGAGGMRQDSIISVLRRNTNCDLHRYAVAREARVRAGSAAPLPDIDLEQVPGSPQDLVRPPTPSGATIRVRNGEPFPEECVREAQADRFGAVALAPLLWQGDLPDDERGRSLFVRDLGPTKNARLRRLYPERPAFVFTPTRVDGPPELLPYAQGMELLWNTPPPG